MIMKEMWKKMNKAVNIAMEFSYTVGDDFLYIED